MSTRVYVLGGVLSAMALAYVWFFLLADPGPLTALAVERPQRPLSFIFNRDILIDEVKVLRYEPGPDGHPEQAYERSVWQLETDPERDSQRRLEDSIRYGRRLPGLRTPEGMSNRAEPLQRGAKYRLEVRAATGEHILLDFEPRHGRG